MATHSLGTQWRRLAGSTWRYTAPTLESIVAVVLIRIGVASLESWRDLTSSDFEGHWWRFFLAGFVLSMAGLVAGLAVLNRTVTRRFDWRQALAIGIVPFLLAITMPVVFWHWPLSSVNSPLWDFRMAFASREGLGAAWILVGLAVASGFRSRT